MSYNADIKVLKTAIEELKYKEQPSNTDPDIDDFSIKFQHKSYLLMATNIDDEQVTSNNIVGDRVYILKVLYKAQTPKEYDEIWNDFESLYRKIRSLSRAISSNELARLSSEKQFIYKGQMEFYYGTRGCS